MTTKDIKLLLGDILTTTALINYLPDSDLQKLPKHLLEQLDKVQIELNEFLRKAI